MKRDGFFPITSIHRDDLIEYFTTKEIASLTDADMEGIASMMKDCYLEGQFWYDLQEAAKAVLEYKEEVTA